MKEIDLMAQVDNTIIKLKYKHLIKEDRVLIEYMLKIGKTKSDISRELDVNRSTVSKEVKKGTVKQRTTTGKTAAFVSQAMAKLRTEYGWTFESVFKSITADNGSEFAL